MKKTFTKQYIAANAGCYNANEIAFLLKSAPDIITIQDTLNSNIPLNDKAWFICRKCELTMQQLKSFAVGCAELALPIYETAYPKNIIVRDCITSTKQYIDEKITEEEFLQKRNAAHSIACAAYASYATYCAVNAASNAARAAYAAYASDAADAAYYAYYAARAASVVYAAYAVRAIGEKKLLQYLVEFVNNN